jgi:aminoglycoside phosphotransferase (APT) family kinase protein
MTSIYEGMMVEEKITEQFKQFLKVKNPDATRIDIGSVRQIFGGASRQTIAMELKITKKTSSISRKVILRREFGKGIIDTKTRTEWDAYIAFSNTEIPVPEMLWLEEDPRWMGTPFLVAEQIVDCEDSLDLFRIPPYNAIREQIGERFCRIMGTIPTLDPAKLGLLEKLELPDPHECWRRELDFWEADINEKELEAHPIVRAAIRRLKRNPPPPPKRLSVVHGDMRAGNFLFNKEGEIKAILDWEMMHLGDPLEDLTWALNPLWSFNEPELLGYMLPRKRAIEIWEDISGIKVDPAVLSWWELFSSVKGMAIWISMNNVYNDGKNTDAVIGYGGLIALDFQRRILIQQMTEGL